MGFPPSLSDEDRAALWRMWHQGRSLHHIARTLSVKAPSVHLFLQKHGGIEPPRRTRAARVLSVHEREEISRGIGAGKSQRQIGRELGRSPSTISREIARNGGAERYRAQLADQAAWNRARRPKCCRLAREPQLCELVAEKLLMDWSPQQISGHLAERYPHEPSLQVSHETIYRTLFIQSRGALKKELRDHLRTKRRFRQSRHKTSVAGHGKLTHPGQNS